MLLTFATTGCPDWPLDRIASNAKNYGFDGIELRTHIDGNHLSSTASPDEVKTIAAKFRDNGVPIMSIMGYTQFATMDEEQLSLSQIQLDRLVDLAAAMKVPYVRAFAGNIPKGARRRQLIEPMAKAIKPVTEKATDLDVRVGFETNEDWSSAKNMLALVQEVDCSGCGIVFDVFDCLSAGSETWEETYDAIKQYICYCHIKDAWFLPDGSHEYVFLGAGDVPIVDIVRRLKKDKYDSMLSFEWEKRLVPELPEPEQVFPHYVYKMKQIIGSV